jgi:endonuclease/exonuclease/phosphatase family metal-dependent hydrolase
MSELKVMTFNLRIEAPEMDGINNLPNRKGKILATIENEKPDLIGFQEALDDTRAWLRDSLSDYVFVGCGRLRGFKGESAPIAFRKDRFEMVNMETFWLSSTPNIPESRYEGTDQSHNPRHVIAVTLKPIDSDSLLLFVNTHTDHVGQRARVSASHQLLRAMREMQADVFVLTGDFNAKPESEEMRLITADQTLGLIDASAGISGSFHNFGRCVPWKCDYVFSTRPCAECHSVEDIPVDGVYLSDHNPIVASFSMEF